MHDDSAPARRRIWVGATTKQTPPRETLYADSRGSDIDPGEFNGQYKKPDHEASLVISRRSVFTDDDSY